MQVVPHEYELRAVSAEKGAPPLRLSTMAQETMLGLTVVVQPR